MQRRDFAASVGPDRIHDLRFEVAEPGGPIG